MSKSNNISLASLGRIAGLPALILAWWNCCVFAAPTPDEALRRMQIAPGFEVAMIVAEPHIRQPVTMSFDDRGRIWVIQYLQYPEPEGLKPVEVDRYLRTKYDRVPEPPPRGPKGADRITICEDTDGDGRADRFKDFVTGLNLASGMALGYGGVFVAQPPYLLFYPDKDGNDVPDADPEVLLTGFGMEDSHAFANSLVWGPDGWLYGAHGSTVTARIRGIEFQQGIWRYHPVTKQFELFAEGGGNTWGVDFDEEGNLIAGTNWGQQIGLHQVQGAYYVKGFAKHGPLHNPHSYGYFEHIPYNGFQGGHVTCGGIVYQGGVFPKKFHGAYIAANLLANGVYWHALEKEGSSFRGHWGGKLLQTDDATFRPIDCLTGPDGAVYVVDWCDKRASHVDPVDTWDRSNGRIYRIAPSGTPWPKRFDLAARSSGELVQLLSHTNNWYRRHARRLLAERKHPDVIPTLLSNTLQTANRRLGLESLWALYLSGGWNDETAARLLQHPYDAIRAWTVRFLGDERSVAPELHSKLTALAAAEPGGVVRNQLACSAKRLSGEQALPIVAALLRRDEDAADPQIPLLIWWALEDKAISHRASVLGLFQANGIWDKALVQKHIAERVARRYAAEGTEAGFRACRQLLESARRAAGGEALRSAQVEALLRGIDLALAGLAPKMAAPLREWVEENWTADNPSLVLVRVGVRLDFPPAAREALRRLASDQTAESERVSLMEALPASAEAGPVLLQVLKKSKSTRLQSGALSALARFADPEIADALIGLYPTFNSEVRQRARSALASREAWALRLLEAVEAGQIAQGDLSLDQLRQLLAHESPELRRRVEKRWGKVGAASDAEKENAINELRLVLKPSGTVGRTGQGNAAEGKKLFQQACAVCHQLFGEGEAIGPDLTGADRKNTEQMLLDIVNPGAYVRPEYVSYEVTTKDSQVLQGLIVASDDAAVTLLDAARQRHMIPRSKIETLEASGTSLMPEGLLEALKPQEIMDLFTYFQSDGAENPKQ